MLTACSNIPTHPSPHRMPYVFATFEDDIEASMRTTATHIAASSAFQPHQERFHVPLLGSLHDYARADVTASTRTAPILRGHFVAWEVKASQLRATVEFDTDDASATLHHLKDGLSRGKPWRTHYVSLGSVAAIDVASHGAFVTAVREAFPIDSGLVFRTGSLDFCDDGARAADIDKANKDAKQQSKPTPEQNMKNKADLKMLNPYAAPSVPAGKPYNPTKPPRRRRRHGKSGPAASPHRKWQREQHGTDSATDRTASSAIDVLIKTGGTGTTADANSANSRVARAAQARAVSRAAAVQKARQQGAHAASGAVLAHP